LKMRNRNRSCTSSGTRNYLQKLDPIVAEDHPCPGEIAMFFLADGEGVRVLADGQFARGLGFEIRPSNGRDP